MKRIILILMASMTVTMAIAQQISHTVQRGETLESIAMKYQVTIDALKAANSDVADFFYVGQKLNIPQSMGIIHRDTTEKKSEETKVVVETQPITNSYQQVHSKSQQNATEGFVDTGGWIIQLNPKNDFYGIQFNMSSKLLYGTMGLEGVLVKHGNLGMNVGFGLGYQHVSDPILFLVNAYPYGKVYMYDKLKNADKILYGEEPQYESSVDFTYGARAEVGIGVNVYQSKSSKYYLTGGYCFHAPEFKFNNVGTAGHWFIGLVYVDF